MLRRLRGVQDVDAELLDMGHAAVGAPSAREAWGCLASNREYWPPVMVAFMGVTFNWRVGRAGGLQFAALASAGGQEAATC